VFNDNAFLNIYVKRLEYLDHLDHLVTHCKNSLLPS